MPEKTPGQRTEVTKSGNWWDATKSNDKRASQTGVATMNGSSRHIGNESNWKVVCTLPDFCCVGNAVVPFDTSAVISRQLISSPDVKAQGVPVYRVGDMHRGVTGDGGKGILSATSQSNGCVKFLDGQSNVKVDGLQVVRHDSRCVINCDVAGVGGALGKVITESKSADSPAEQTKPNTELQALIDKANDKRSLWNKAEKFFSEAWDGTKRVAGAMWENPGETGIGVLKGIGNLPSDLGNLAVLGAKYTGPLSPALQSQMLNYAAMQAYQNGNIAQANFLATCGSQIMSFGHVGDIFELTNDAQKGGAFLSMVVPMGAVAKGASTIAKAVRAGDTVADLSRTANATGDAARTANAASDAARPADATAHGAKAPDAADAAKTTDASSDAVGSGSGVHIGGIRKGPIPDEAPKNLEEQILMADTKAKDQIKHEDLTTTHGGPNLPGLSDVNRLVDNYGGTKEDWVKVTSRSENINGYSTSVHYFKNVKTLQSVEFKFKRDWIPSRKPPKR